MMKLSPVVSIIVPVYNAEKYLRRCIDSVLAQTYQDFELLLIDDGSKDSSGAICDEYAKKVTRVKVFHKENGGVSSARNVGLDNAKGEYITFVDADDWIKPLYLEHLLRGIEKSDMVIAYATVFRENDNEGVEEKYLEHDITDKNFSLLFEENAMSWHTSPWSKLYKRKIIETHRFRFEVDVHLGEDAIFLYSYMLQTRKIKVVCHTDYCYMSEVIGSLTKRTNALQSELVAMQKIHSLVDRMVTERDLSEKARNELNWLKAFYVNRVLNSLYNNKVLREYRIKVLRNLDLKCYVTNIKPNNFRLKFSTFLIKCHFLNLYDFCRSTLSIIKNVQGIGCSSCL